MKADDVQLLLQLMAGTKGAQVCVCVGSFQAAVLTSRIMPGDTNRPNIKTNRPNTALQ
jgi:hypothetical protein